MSTMRGAARDPHAGPADQGVREFDSARTRGRAPRRSRRHRGPAAGPGHVRARCAPASAARPLPRLPAAERCVRRRVRRQLRLDRAGRRRLGSRRRVRPGPRRHAEAHLPQRVHGARAEAGSTLDRIKADDTVSYASYSTPEQLAERVAADLATLLAERFDGARSAAGGCLHARPFGGCPPRTPRRSDGRTMSAPCSSCSPATACGW